MRRLLLVYALIAASGDDVNALRTGSASPVSISFDDAAPLASVRPTYLSVNVDSGSLFQLFDFSDAVLQQLVRNLVQAAPMQLRVGGGAADNAFFTGVGGARGNCSLPLFDPTIDVCIDADYMAEICAFAAATGVGLVWDLNVALRTPGSGTGSWNSTNARALFEFLVSQHGACPIAAWQLGNEVE